MVQALIRPDKSFVLCMNAVTALPVTMEPDCLLLSYSFTITTSLKTDAFFSVLFALSDSYGLCFFKILYVLVVIRWQLITILLQKIFTC